jgi:hypothetical protein
LGIEVEVIETLAVWKGGEFQVGFDPPVTPGSEFDIEQSIDDIDWLRFVDPGKFKDIVESIECSRHLEVSKSGTNSLIGQLSQHGDTS